LDSNDKFKGPLLLLLLLSSSSSSTVNRTIYHSSSYTLTFSEDVLPVTNTTDIPLALLIPNQSTPAPPPSVNITEHRFSPITVYINSLQRTAE